MRVLAFLVLILAISTISNAQVLNGTFVTYLDHFRPQNVERVTFYFEANYVHYEGGGPFYIYIKDARNNAFQWVLDGLMVDIAEETRAALFTFSPRYFGINRPTQNATFENLEYLTIEQSLADIATFVRYLRIINAPYNPKVILWGSGYGGTFATWARKKFPHLVDAAWSSSGVFLTDVYSSSQYDDLGSVLSSAGSPRCRDLLSDAFSFIEYLIENDGGEILQEKFHLCHPVDTESMLDSAAFYESHINDVFAIINRDHLNGLTNFCDGMEAVPGDAFESFARWVDDTFGSSQCYDHTFNGQVERFGNIQWNTVGTDNGRRQWYYIQCTQLGLFLVPAESSWIPLDIPIEYHVERCEQLYGENYDSSLLTIANANIIRQFGSINPSVSRVIYSNGAIDPYLNTGILVARDASEVVIIIEGYSKSADLTSINPESDTQALVEAKEEIRSQIIEWSLN